MKKFANTPKEQIKLEKKRFEQKQKQEKKKDKLIEMGKGNKKLI